MQTDNVSRPITHQRVRLGAAVLGACLAAGCGGPNLAEVTGKVLVDGEPNGNVVVYFESKETNKTFRSVSRSDQSYFLQMPSGETGIPPGEYRVWLGIAPGLDGLPESKKLEKNVPKKYWDKNSGLTCTVPAEGTSYAIEIGK